MSDKLGKMITNFIEVEKNGVKVVIKQQYDKEINDINIDFSEHDKVFEDKIAKLEKELEEWKSEAREIKKNRDEQLKSFRKAVEPYVDIGHMHETIEDLKQHIAELESKETVDLPFDPLECANYLINSTYERETNGIERAFHNLPDKVNSDRYTIDDLEQIAEHLLVYCKHNKEREE